MILELLLAIILLGFLISKKSQKPSDMPPGSFGWPLVGCLPPRNMHITEHLANLKSQYGKIYTTKWGSRPVVVLADYDLIKKALNHPDFQDRPDLYSIMLFNYFKNTGIVFASGKVWHENRRFLIRHLRDLGMGKTRLEVSIQEEAEMLVKYLEQHSLDEPTGIDLSINVAVLNVIWQLLANKRYDADDEEVLEYNRNTETDFDIIQGPIFLLDFMPWLQNVLPRYLKKNIMQIDVLESHRNSFEVHIRRVIQEHVTKLDRENPIDVIDFYLMEIEARKDDPETNFQSDYVDLASIMGDMFAAGSETTATTLRWMILHMAINQEVQKKIHEALDKAVAGDRLPSLDDRAELAYIDATLLDVMRLSSLVPTNLPHETGATVQFEGYTIPKGTMIIPCLEMCHRDPQFWDHPDELYPEHFLDQDGKLDSKREGFLPFSTGRRQCLGESLARMELFLFASAILQRFTIEAPPGVTLKALTDPDKKLFNTPSPFKVVLRKRI